MPQQKLRAEFRKKRNQLSAQQQQQSRVKILDTCLQYTQLPQANIVACYLANDGEIDPSAIIEYCWQHKKTVLLPVLHPFSQGHLVFVEYHPNSVMHANRYGIPEPVVSSQTIFPLTQIELIMTPLVAFDSTGNRLGMGGGYYDRTLAPVKRDKLKIELIGLAHACQQSAKLTTSHWDIPLNGIATPEQFFHTK